ncbi:MAG TPA: hypothetical protein VG225_05350 [Terracidiphilus sp.]|jgi:hypothetical protein|nr:hypothetical protein [Terracidiphilus sp.]
MFRFVRGCTVVLLAASVASAQVKTDPFYSKAATSVWDRLWVGENTRPVVVVSPDGRSRATAAYTESDDDENVDVVLSGAVGMWKVNIGLGVGAELLWSPDSKALFITTSDGVRNGPYRLYVIDRFEGELEKRELTDLIVHRFGHPVKCQAPEDPNIAGIAWVPGSHRLWVAAEIVHHSICDSYGTFRAYEVDPQKMAIVRSLNQIEAKRILGGELGPELADAPDKCILRPSACYLPWNHPDLHLHQ